MKVNYDLIYTTETKEYFDWVKTAGQWKAQKLYDLLEEDTTQSILEIGAGRGDVLQACRSFAVKIGADISHKVLLQQQQEYGARKLVVIDADGDLPFGNQKVDFVLLCDILEHVQDPVSLLLEATRVGKKVLLKIPIEKALLTRFMHKIRGVEYGIGHPSGHLYCWDLADIYLLLKQANVNILKGEFVPTPINLMKKKTYMKTILLYITAGLDVLAGGKRVTRFLIGGSYFAVAKGGCSFAQNQERDGQLCQQ